MNDPTPDGMPDQPGPTGARQGDTAAATPHDSEPAKTNPSCHQPTGRQDPGHGRDTHIDRPSPAATLLMTTDPSTFATLLDTLTDWDA
jgi:hypothetical protein